jgi:hypothetical protein
VIAKLIYTAIASADGYVEDATGSFDWAAPDDELLRLSSMTSSARSAATRAWSGT